MQEIVADYEEHFAAGPPGDPGEIGKQRFATSYVKTAERTGSLAALCRAALATLGLGLFNFCIVTAVPSVVPAGATVVMPFETPLARIATAVGLIASGLLVTVGSVYPARYFVRAMARYVRMNFSVVRGAYGNEV